MIAAEIGVETSYARVGVMLVGKWSGLPRGVDEQQTGNVLVQRGPADVRRLKHAIVSERPQWLLVGGDVDEPSARALTLSAQAMRSTIRLAMLGTTDEPRRCERWMRRGCQVYLPDDVGAQRLADAIEASDDLGMVVIDRAFQDAARARQVQPVDNLTRREEEVLQLLAMGQRNADIAGSLHLTENTVEFHVSRVLAKLGVRNRVEAVDRATDLGLT